jgi:roadblock/LC7 domain-containing protein
MIARTIALATLMLATCGTALARDPEQLSRWAEEGKVRAEKMRGLLFLHDVPVELMSRAKIETEILEMVDRDMPPEYRRQIDLSYKAFGLVPMDSDVLNDMIKLVVSQAGGFYDPEAKHVILPNDLEEFMGEMVGEMLAGAEGFMDPMMRNILTHEFTHALQDQHHDLNTMMGMAMDDDDVKLALTALVEGDATLIGTGAMMDEAGDMTGLLKQDPAAMGAMMGAGGGMMGAEANAMPAILKETLIFPYVYGYILVTTMVQDGGFARVDKAFVDPPLSTEQVLHIEKYLGEQRDEPIEITLPAVNLIEFGWHSVGQNSMGEFQTRVMLGNSPDAIVAAEGWDGDRYQVWQHDDGRLAVAWISVWDSDADARQFAEELIYHEGKRFTGDAGKTRSTNANGRYELAVGGEDDLSWATVEGDTVVLTRGFPADTVGAIEGSIRGLSTKTIKTWESVKAASEAWNAQHEAEAEVPVP